jgi:hypothetical protein
MFMVVVEGDGVARVIGGSTFMLEPIEELLRVDRDDPERVIFLHSPLILQNFCKQQNSWRMISKSVNG